MNDISTSTQATIETNPWLYFSYLSSTICKRKWKFQHQISNTGVSFN